MDVVGSMLFKKKVSDSFDKVEKSLFGEEKKPKEPEGPSVTSKMSDVFTSDKSKAEARIAERKKEREAASEELRKKYAAQRAADGLEPVDISGKKSTTTSSSSSSSSAAAGGGAGASVKKFFTEDLPSGTKKAGAATKNFFTEDIPQATKSAVGKIKGEEPAAAAPPPPAESSGPMGKLKGLFKK